MMDCFALDNENTKLNFYILDTIPCIGPSRISKLPRDTAHVSEWDIFSLHKFNIKNMCQNDSFNVYVIISDKTFV
jgi:hypothetical protein